ncbi:hypothetical protein OUZ56_008385 [Daphnia magna]|uniref:Uncharacterized protein n=1 Tax=Daphnia magna TaxID=35525 RepID=A0ABR0ACZ5_9CRUS|nr:hypothetical protein OUZ56_008385 [Daphnia magna]
MDLRVATLVSVLEWGQSSAIWKMESEPLLSDRSCSLALDGGRGICSAQTSLRLNTINDKKQKRCPDERPLPCMVPKCKLVCNVVADFCQLGANLDANRWYDKERDARQTSARYCKLYIGDNKIHCKNSIAPDILPTLRSLR